MMHKPVIVIGGGGHAKTCIDLLLRQNYSILGYVDVTNQGSLFGQIPYLGDDSVILRYEPNEVALVNGVGKIGHSLKRSEIFLEFQAKKYRFETLIHDTAVVSSFALISKGVQIMAGSIIQAGAFLGENVIVNTRATVDHDCQIGAHTHISPGVILCGSVSIGEHTHVGAGATIIQGLSIGKSVVVGAGSLVLKPVMEGITLYGVPAKEVK